MGEPHEKLVRRALRRQAQGRTVQAPGRETLDARPTTRELDPIASAVWSGGDSANTARCRVSVDFQRESKHVAGGANQ